MESMPMFWPMIFLGVVVLVGGGTLAYLYNDHRKSHLERERLGREAAARFPDVLARELRGAKLSGFRFREFAEACEVPPGEAARVARELYARVARKVVEDGVVTDGERNQLDRLAAALEIGPSDALAIEREAKSGRYRDAVASILADGVISSEESRLLQSLRTGLGLSRIEGFRAAEDVTCEAYIDLIRCVAYAGPPDDGLLRYVAEFKEALALDDGSSAARVRTELRALYRELVFYVVSDGEVTGDEEAMLVWLRGEAGLSAAETRDDDEMLERVRRLGACRRGELPIVRTSKLLEGGEICHFDEGCVYVSTTPTGRVNTTSGELIVTSRRVIFTSAGKGFEFAPSKLIDIGYLSGRTGLAIKVSGRRGAGEYCVADPQALEAVLCGVVRKHKYLLTEGYSSVRSRHIPPEVKREVYQRDGGRCVQCSAGDYLEFDHIIPHARGGANTVGNVQILCRRCNNAKRDRV